MNVDTSLFEHLGGLVKRAAKTQAGIIDGENPIKLDTTDPVKLWIVQVGIILIVSQLLATLCARIRQPRVIAEVVGGVILGPSILGRIPNFSDNIFPKDSLPYLNLTATIALVLFLFLIGLETDVSAMRRLLKKAGPISAAGILLPFGLGAAVSVPIYNTFVNPDKVSFGHFTLFTCVAMSITAFPVLCRILVETKLLETNVGIIVLAAGVGNDVLGWVLLALTVALVNATSGLSALYVLLTGIAWTLFILFPVKWGFHYIARKTGSLDGRGEPSPFMMMLTFLLVFTSAFFTDIIGIHPIFGGFLAGLAIPHEGGFAIALVEKIEDLVTILLLPIYFALSGLKTDLGTLNTGKAWGYAFLLIIVAFLGKFIGCMGSARLLGFNTRESGAIGALMSCKGLVELIVLNVGLSAGILDTRLFSMFVFMAIILTLVTTPLTLAIYPASVRKTNEEPLADSHSSRSDEKATGTDSGLATLPRGDHSASAALVDGAKSKFTVVLERIEHLPAVMTVVQLLQQSSPSPAFSTPAPTRKVDALRLIELSERTSAVMRGADNAAEVLGRDALVKVFELFARLNRLAVSSALSVVPYGEYAASVVGHANRVGSDMIVLPWSASAPVAPTTPTSEHPQAGPSTSAASPSGPSSYNPFAGLFGVSASSHPATPSTENSVVYSQFIRQVFTQTSSTSADVAVVVDRGASAGSSTEGNPADGQHIFLPFFGGPDDRLALTLVVQLCAGNPAVTATVLRITKTEEELDRFETSDSVADQKARQAQAQNFTISSFAGNFPDTVYAHPTTETRMSSQTADHVLWARVSAPSANPRITFSDITSSQPLQSALEHAQSLSTSNSKAIIVAIGRARRLAVESHAIELRDIALRAKAQSTGELRKTVGDVASAFIVASPWPLLVVQASSGGQTSLDV